MSLQKKIDNLNGMAQVALILMQAELFRREVAEITGLGIDGVRFTVILDAPEGSIIEEYTAEHFEHFCGGRYYLPEEAPYDPEHVNIIVDPQEVEVEPDPEPQEVGLSAAMREALQEYIGPDHDFEVIDLEELLG